MCMLFLWKKIIQNQFSFLCYINGCLFTATFPRRKMSLPQEGSSVLRNFFSRYSFFTRSAGFVFPFHCVSEVLGPFPLKKLKLKIWPDKVYALLVGSQRIIRYKCPWCWCTDQGTAETDWSNTGRKGSSKETKASQKYYNGCHSKGEAMWCLHSLHQPHLSTATLVECIM